MRARALLRRLDTTEVTGLTAASLAAAIAAQIRAGTLPAGIELPSERDLATAMGRSRGIVARAYEQLRTQGLVHTRQGAGTTIGCCAGPWASSRAAELDPVLPVLPSGMPTEAGRTIDLRSLRWADLGPPVASRSERPRSPGRIDETPGVVVDGPVRALDVALTTLLRPGEPVLVPALTDPRVRALLRVRGLRPVVLPVDAQGRADVPAWVQRLRSRAAPVAALAATHAPPAGVSLATHERRLLVEAAAAGEVTLVDDRSRDGLWLATPPPASLEALDADERTISLRSVADGMGAGGDQLRVQTRSPALRERLAAVALALDATSRSAASSPPANASVAPHAAAPIEHDGGDTPLSARRRQHLVDHTEVTIRIVTPAAPRVRVAPALGGASRLLHLTAIPGSVVADAARERGVLVHPAADCAVGATDPAGVVISLTGPTEALVTGLRVLLEVVDELA